LWNNHSVDVQVTNKLLGEYHTKKTWQKTRHVLPPTHIPKLEIIFAYEGNNTIKSFRIGTKSSVKIL